MHVLKTVGSHIVEWEPDRIVFKIQDETETKYQYEFIFIGDSWQVTTEPYKGIRQFTNINDLLCYFNTTTISYLTRKEPKKTFWQKVLDWLKWADSASGNTLRLHREIWSSILHRSTTKRKVQ